jgi:hypothetical protein
MPNNKAAGFELFNPKQLETALGQGSFNPMYARPGTVERGMANAESMARKQFLSNKRNANYGTSRGPAFNTAARNSQEYWLKKALGRNAVLNKAAAAYEATWSRPSSIGSSPSPVFPVANAVETGGRKKTRRTKKAKKNAKKQTRRR